MKTLLKKLVEASGPSGYESNVREIIRNEISPYSKQVNVDTFGNLIVRIGEKSKDGLRIMIAAHMDEIGIIVTHVEKNGLIRFSNIGGVFLRHLAGSRVVFLNGARGVINSDKAEDLSKLQSMDKYFIDAGATSAKNCPVKTGDLGVFDQEFVDLGQRVVAKAFDDRSSCAALIEVIKQIKNTPHELVFVFSTQEEVGSRGAQAAAYGIDADLGIAIDVTPVGNILGKNMQVDLGSGPAIKVRDFGFIVDPRVVNWMVEAANKIKVPYQLEVLEVGTTDAKVMQITKAGMLAGAVSIPCRYVHSPSEMIDMVDYENTIKLLVQLLGNRVIIK